MRTWIVTGVLALLLMGRAGAAAKYGERDVAALVEIAQSEKEPEARRARACRELEHTDVRTQMSVLRRLLREERSLDIRLSAACTLAALGDHKAPKDLLLVTAYDGESTPNCTRGDVCLALARLGDPAAEMHLEKALHSPTPGEEPDFHENVCRALGILNTSGAHRLLLSALRTGAPDVREAAVIALAKAATEPKNTDRAQAKTAILQAARTDSEEKVAEQACSVLFWNGVDGPGFYRLMESDPDPKVRARCARVMDRHYLTPARLTRLNTALAREKDPGVRAAMRATIADQRAVRP